MKMLKMLKIAYHKDIVLINLSEFEIYRNYRNNYNDVKQLNDYMTDSPFKLPNLSSVCITGYVFNLYGDVKQITRIPFEDVEKNCEIENYIENNSLIFIQNE